MLMERILSRGNLLTTLKRVEKNKGSHGVDEMPVQNLRAHILEHWESMKIALLEVTYEPQAVRRVEIPKPDGGVSTRNTQGTPQGGPISPLISNIVLDELDKELEARGNKFVRYADDCNIYLKTRKAGTRVINSVTTFIEDKLKLKVNRAKSVVDRPWRRKFLGFSFTFNMEPKVRIAKESVKRMKAKIREITSRKKPYPMEYRIKKLNQYLIGWYGYFALADTPSVFKYLDSWIRRRLRMCVWKEWKLPKTRVRKLKGLGVPKGKDYE